MGLRATAGMHIDDNGAPPRLRTHDYVEDARRPLRVYRHELARPVSIHWHEFFELGFVIGGAGVHRCNGGVARLVPGSVFLLTPADLHALGPAGDRTLRLYDVIFTPAALPEETKQLLAHWPPATGAQLPEPVPALRPDIERLWEEEERDAFGRDQVQVATLQRIVVDLVRLAARDTDGQILARRADPVRVAIAWIDQSFRRPITLADAAARAGLSPSYFSERFHAFTGAPFQRYVQHRRLQFARTLLATSDISITDVCYASGFNTLSHFERAFRTRYGQSPRAWRIANEA